MRQIRKFQAALKFSAPLLLLLLSSCAFEFDDTDKIYDVEYRYRIFGASPNTVCIRPLIVDKEPYQRVISKHIEPANYTVITDGYGNQYAKFNFDGVANGSDVRIVMRYRVKLYFKAYNLKEAVTQQVLPGDARAYLRPEQYIESDHPDIAGLASQLTSDKATDGEKVRSIYQWVHKNIAYRSEEKGGSALEALNKKSAKCAGYSHLFTALCRATGIPARILSGYVYKPHDGPWISEMHAWAEVYLSGKGWVQIEPTFYPGGGPFYQNGAYLGDVYCGIMPANHLVESRAGSIQELSGFNEIQSLLKIEPVKKAQE